MGDSRRFYVAANSRDDANRAADLIKRLENAGHHCTFDWTGFSPEAARDRGEHMLNSARFSDFTVLIWNEYLLGALLECGAALAAGRSLYIVGLPDPSIFWDLTNVVIVKDEDALFDALEVRVSV